MIHLQLLTLQNLVTPDHKQEKCPYRAVHGVRCYRITPGPGWVPPGCCKNKPCSGENPERQQIWQALSATCKCLKKTSQQKQIALEAALHKKIWRLWKQYNEFITPQNFKVRSFPCSPSEKHLSADPHFYSQAITFLQWIQYIVKTPPNSRQHFLQRLKLKGKTAFSSSALYK